MNAALLGGLRASARRPGPHGTTGSLRGRSDTGSVRGRQHHGGTGVATATTNTSTTAAAMDADPICSGQCIRRILSMRYIMAILGAMLMATLYGLKVNLSVAIVAMINNTAIAGNKTSHVDNSSEVCESGAGSDSYVKPEDGPFNWDESVQGLVLGSYFWGYLVSQMPAGLLSEKFSAKWVLFVSGLLNIIGTLLTPITAYWHYGALLVMRVLEGIGGGLSFPAMHVMLARWAPVTERNLISSIVYAGTSIGTVISMVSSGWLVALGGWESVFYVMGLLAIIWCVLWVFLVFDSPETHPFISQEEKELIVNSLGPSHKEPESTPWVKIFTSGPFLAILVAHVCSNSGWYLVLTQLPTYMSRILMFPIKTNATLSAMPFLLQWIFTMVFSKILDVLRSKGKLTAGQVRKISTAVASILPAIALTAVPFFGCDQVAVVAMMAVAITSFGGMFCGFLANHIDIAPNYAGTLMGITNTVATIPGFVVPIFIGYLTAGSQTIGQWQIAFSTISIILLVEFVVYTIFGSGEQQPWNSTNPQGQP